MPPLRGLLVCSAGSGAGAGADESGSVIEGLLANLPGLTFIPKLDVGDTAAITARLEAHSLNSEFILYFERDQLFLSKVDARGRFGRDLVALETAMLQRRTTAPTELQKACLGAGSVGSDAGVRVLDLFAGWGMDGFGLAAGGGLVTCVEYQPAMVALLRDARRRVPAALAARLQVARGDALQALSADCTDAVDVVYLDPMFPVRKKGALPNKRLQWLSQLASGFPDTAVNDLIDLARSRALKQVVLKRRRKDPVIGSPVRQVVGTSVRYDIYSALEAN